MGLRPFVASELFAFSIAARTANFFFDIVRMLSTSPAPDVGLLATEL
jgi:hypothetical protein